MSEDLKKVCEAQSEKLSMLETALEEAAKEIDRLKKDNQSLREIQQGQGSEGSATFKAQQLASQRLQALQEEKENHSRTSNALANAKKDLRVALEKIEILEKELKAIPKAETK